MVYESELLHSHHNALQDKGPIKMNLGGISG